MLGSLGAPASSTTKTGRHDITERDLFTLLSAIALYIEVFYVILSRAHFYNIYQIIQFLEVLRSIISFLFGKVPKHAVVDNKRSLAVTCLL